MEQIQLNEWTMNVSSRQIPFPHILKGRELLRDWSSFFPHENTWVQKELAIPSLIVRLDCADIGGQLKIYEVEERPSGIGISTLLSEAFKAKLDGIIKGWPKIQVIISPLHHKGDDHVWTEVVQSPSPGSLLIVRAEPEEEEFHALASRSISSVRKKGSKQYGEHMDLWTRVHFLDPDELLWEKGFVLKPLQGSKCHGIEIWDIQRRHGCSTRKRILDTLSRFSFMYQQPFIPPMESGMVEFKWMLFRVFYGYDMKKAQWEYLGGVWVARSNLKIHGARDAICGPLEVD